LHATRPVSVGDGLPTGICEKPDLVGEKGLLYCDVSLSLSIAPSDSSVLVVHAIDLDNPMTASWTRIEGLKGSLRGKLSRDSLQLDKPYQVWGCTSFEAPLGYQVRRQLEWLAECNVLLDVLVTLIFDYLEFKTLLLPDHVLVA
jgi:hypothetical protein